MCVKRSCYNDFECDYYGILTKILDLIYYGAENKIMLLRFNWYDTERA